MNDTEPAPAVQVATAADGSRLHLVDIAPEALPPVGKRDLLRAWAAAHEAARAECRGEQRRFGFRNPDGSLTLLALADADAGCWAQAVDRTIGLGSLHGLSVCVRLLALIELLTRDRSLIGLLSIKAGDVDLHPALLRAAASGPLTSAGPLRLGAVSPGRRLCPRPCLDPNRSVRMIVFKAAARWLSAATLATLLAGCAAAPPPNPARQAELEACRSRADAVFQKQNRYLLSERGNLDAPGSGSDPDYDKSIDTASLAGRFGRDQQVADCVSGSGAGAPGGSLPAGGDASSGPPTASKQ